MKCNSIAVYDGLRAWSPENFRASGGFEANQAEVCQTRTLTLLPYLCWYACVHVSQSETLNMETTSLMMQALWSGPLTLTFIQAFAGAIRCSVEELLV